MIAEQLEEAIKKKAKNQVDDNKDKMESTEEVIKHQVTHKESIIHDSLETFVKPEREG